MGGEQLKDLRNYDDLGIFPTSDGGTPSLFPKHPAPSLKKNIRTCFLQLFSPINWNEEQLVVANTLLLEL